MDSIIGELSLRLYQLLSLLRRRPEEARVHFSLLVLKGHIEAHNVAVLEATGHVGLSAAVIEDQTTHQLRLGGHLVLHVHNFDHVQVDVIIARDCIHRVDHNFGKRIRNARVNLRVQRSLGNFEKEIASDFGRHLERLKVLHALSLGKFETVNNDSGVDSLAEVALRLTHKLSNEKYIRGGTIADDIILGSGCTANHSRGGVLDLHFMQKYATIFGQLNLASSSNKHFDGSFGAEVCLEDFLESFSSVDIDAEGSSFANDVCLGIDELK